MYKFFLNGSTTKRRSSVFFVEAGLTLVHDLVFLDVDVLIGVMRRRVSTCAVGHLPHEASDLVEVALLLRALGFGAVDDRGWVGAGLVLLEVPVKVGLLPETPVTQRTLERLLLVVDVPDMPLEIGRDGERPFAILALVWLLSGVRPQVAGQVG